MKGSVQGKEAQVGGWGHLPVTGRDGDQRLEGALKVDLCRKNWSQAKGTGHPASPSSPQPLGSPGLPIAFSLLPPGDPHRPSSA